MNATWKRELRSAERGQAAVEYAIVMPTFVFFILAIIQLTMMHHARLLAEYAAFTAARAGSVWNADKGVMTDAAEMALVPSFGIGKENVGLGVQVTGSRDLASFGTTWAAFRVLNKTSSALGLPLVKVDVLNPTQETIEALGGNRKEANFDEPAERAATQLTIRLTYLYNMRIPYANWIIWQTYMGSLGGMKFARKVDGWYTNIGPFSTKVSSKAARLAGATAGAQPPNACYTGLTGSDMLKLGTAAQGSIYLIPIVTTYTIRMQSNPIKSRLPRRSDVMGGCS